MLKIEEVDWNKARKVVKELRDDWYEEFDEAEGGFMGWRKIKNNNVVSFKEFSKWLESGD